ncbi:MAG: hypothetical protein AB7P94_16675 [Steroidobacteraceae bacterium]
MNAPRKLPADVVDQLLRRLVATYGRRFWLQYEGAEASDVRAIWSRELGGYTERQDAISWAFDNLPEQPPNAIEFRNLCRRAPAPTTPALPLPPADPVRAAALVEQVRQMFATSRSVDGLAWARDAIAKAERGEHVSACTLRAARAVAHRLNVAGPAET